MSLDYCDAVGWPALPAIVHKVEPAEQWRKHKWIRRCRPLWFRALCPTPTPADYRAIKIGKVRRSKRA